MDVGHVVVPYPIKGNMAELGKVKNGKVLGKSGMGFGQGSEKGGQVFLLCSQDGEHGGIEFQGVIPPVHE